VNVRVVSATNRDLADAVRDGSFREDLFYRLNVITITMPPLREHAEDIPLLIEHFLSRIAARTGKPVCKLDPGSLRYFGGYHWPGNVRELENEIERAAMLSDGVITPAHLSEHLLFQCLPGGASAAPAADMLNERDLEGKSLKDVMDIACERAERAAILRALKKARGEKKEAARILDVSRPTLYARLKRYNIASPE
jgi:two-component system response regulator HydG